MQNTEALLAFYRDLGFTVSKNANLCSVYVGDQMINFHRPTLWPRETFTPRAPAAKPALRGFVFCMGRYTGNVEGDDGPSRC
jgi:hypothetical protein